MYVVANFGDKVVAVDDSVREEISAGLGIVDMYEGGLNGAGNVFYEGEFIVLKTTVGRQIDAMKKSGWTQESPQHDLVSHRLEAWASVEPLTAFIAAHREDFLGYGQAADRFAGSIADPENHIVVSLSST
ncbi:hypothetical protein HerbRD11066_64380 [Herbidospora sp. RD11066]